MRIRPALLAESRGRPAKEASHRMRQLEPWRGTRRRSTPASVIAACTRLRHDGDWRGACLTAGFQLDIDLADIADRFGEQGRKLIDDDLSALAPDLLRQYLAAEYHEPGHPYRTYPLERSAPPSGSPSKDPVLVVTAPRPPNGRQRPRLTVLGPDHRPDRVGRPLPVWCWRADAVTERRAAYTADAEARPEVGLLRRGELSRHDLHPLVHDVLYPDQVQSPQPTRWGWPAVKVRCDHTWHDVQITGGRLVTLAHTDDEIAREFVLGGLTGPMLGCAIICDQWLTGEGRLPKRLRRARSQFFQHVWYGHTEDVLDMMDAGFDIGVTDAAGATLTHYLHRLDENRLLPRIRAVGLSLDARDHRGRTPLHYAAEADAPDIMTLLVSAGADPRLTDQAGRTPQDVLTRTTQRG